MEEICKLIPHRPPFLFVDKILEMTEDSLIAQFFVDPGLSFFVGHYPGEPVMPGVILSESVFQTAACFLAKKLDLAEKTKDKGIPVLSRIENAKFKSIVRPNDTLRISATLVEIIQKFYIMKGTIHNQSSKLVLNIDFILTVVDKI